MLISGDPTRLPPDEIKDIEVEMTIIDGKVVWSRPRINPDVAKVEDAAASRRPRVKL